MTIDSISRRLLDMESSLITFKVNLSTKGRNGTRKDYKSVYEYESDKYNDKKTLATLYVNFNYYLVIEKKESDLKIFFTYPDLVKLKNFFKKALKWKKEKIWFEEEGKMYIDLEDKDKKDFILTFITLFEKGIYINPTVIKYEDSKDKKGIQLSCEENKDSVYFSYDELEILNDMICNTDFVNLGQSLVNYMVSLPEEDLNVTSYKKEAYFQSKGMELPRAKMKRSVG